MRSTAQLCCGEGECESKRGCTGTDIERWGTSKHPNRTNCCEPAAMARIAVKLAGQASDLGKELLLGGRHVHVSNVGHDDGIGQWCEHRVHIGQ